MARINVHAGHNPAGKTACGAVGILDESRENRKVAKAMIKKLRAKGHTVYDCTVSDGTSARDVLQKICARCNRNSVDLDVSVHFNAGADDTKGDGATTGTEVHVVSTSGIRGKAAGAVCKKMAKLGFKNRGAKVNKGLYYLNHTKAPAILIEVCFVDDKDDADLYKKIGAAKIGGKIANAIDSVL